MYYTICIFYLYQCGKWQCFSTELQNILIWYSQDRPKVFHCLSTALSCPPGKSTEIGHHSSVIMLMQFKRV